MGPCVTGPLLITPPQSSRMSLPALGGAFTTEGCGSRDGSNPPMRSYMYQQNEPMTPT